MIGWFQKHRKYLIVTLWISSASFVGAGFVGWGEYSRISKEELAVGGEKYTAQQIKAFAKSSGKQVDEVRKLLAELEMMRIFLAKSGKVASDEQVREIVFNSPEFQENGIFSESLYKKTIAASPAGSIKKYEAAVRRMLEFQIAELYLDGLTKPFKNEEVLAEEKEMEMLSYKKEYLPEKLSEATIKKWNESGKINKTESIGKIESLSIDMSSKGESASTPSEKDKMEKLAKKILKQAKLDIKAGKQISNDIKKSVTNSNGGAVGDFFCKETLCVLVSKITKTKQNKDLETLEEEMNELEYKSVVAKKMDNLGDGIVYDAMLPVDMMVALIDDKDKERASTFKEPATIVRSYEPKEFYIIKKDKKTYMLNVGTQEYFENAKLKNEEKKKSIISLFVKKIAVKEGLEDEIK